MTPTEDNGAANLVLHKTPESGAAVEICDVDDLENSQEPAAALTADQAIPRILPP